MRSLIVFLFCCIAVGGFAEEELQEELLLSSPEQLSGLMTRQEHLIGGVVSPMSGQVSLRQIDLIAKGAQNIVFFRSYIPPYIPSVFPKHKYCQEEYNKKYLQAHLAKTYKGWQFFPHLRLHFNPMTRQVRLSESSGATFDFQLLDSGSNFASALYAVSNISADEPSGENDPRNIRVFQEDRDKIIVYTADGTTRFYQKNGLATKSAYLFLLQKEILPNGKVLRYRYNEKRELSCVESLDPKERYVYASIHVDGSLDKGYYHFTTSSKTHADYKYEKKAMHVKIKEKTKKGAHKENLHLNYPPILTAVSSPFYREESLDYCRCFLLATYFGKTQVFKTLNGSFGEDAHYRVHKLFAPVAMDDSFQPVYEMQYDPPIAGRKEGVTQVKNSDGTSISYHFSKSLLLSSIRYFGQEGELKKEKLFSWQENNWLQSISIKDACGNLLSKKSYEFDRFGNPILEVFTGDLTGDGSQESYHIRRKFSQDGKNLLIEEEQENGKVLCFSYLPSTNLITKKLIKDHDHIVLRNFFLYDDCYNLIQSITDDGNGQDIQDLSGVTQKVIKKITLRKQNPFLHMPEWIEEWGLENGEEKLFTKKHLIYDDFGNIAQEEIYDSQDVYRYTIYKEYNERGDLLSETNALGQKKFYGYNAKGLCNFEKNFSGRLQKKMTYDLQGRLRSQTKKGDDGSNHHSIFSYDYHDRKIAECDPLGNDTHYEYDLLVNKICKTKFPKIASFDLVTTKASYDPCGNMLTKEDSLGNTTRYSYNAYGSCTQITHSDGVKEYFRYKKDGSLLSHKEPSGRTIHYERDIFGRILSKTYTFQGEIIAKAHFSYSGFHLLSETDFEGNVTTYAYDGIGKKISEEKCGRKIDFIYDALGRLLSTYQYDDENTLVIQYEKDLEGRILEETKMDLDSHLLYKISYTYDADGNRNSITRYINDAPVTNFFSYDSLGRLIEKKDPDVYEISYNEGHINEIGQRVLQVSTKDPQRIITVETKDAMDRIVKKEVINPWKNTLSCEERVFDPNGNKIYQKDHVYINGTYKNTQTIAYTYTPRNQLESFTRGYGTKEERKTSYAYDDIGNVKTKTLPCGITLFYTYSRLDHLTCLQSSDGSIFHEFCHDRLGNITYACDKLSSIFLTRKVDPFGNVLQEVFSTGAAIDKTYDAFDRLTLVKIEENGAISYSYDPLFLRKVDRISNSGKVLYTHNYEEYDADGNLTQEHLIGNLGKVVHKTNAKGLKSSLTSPYLLQDCMYDEVGNLIYNNIDQHSYNYTYDDLSQMTYDSFNCYRYDSLYNRIEKNGKQIKINDLNEVAHDLNGNQRLKQGFSLRYDPLNRLIEAASYDTKIVFTYDPLDRRMGKIVYTATAFGWKETERENYLYQGNNEIGAFNAGFKNLKVLGLGVPIAIELQEKVFAPIIDVQGNVRKLIDLETASATCYEFTSFGEELHPIKEDSYNPWRFASKRLDPELGLIYFGKRYYDPEWGRWLSIDPAGFIDSVNLYQYVFNNPLRYADPNGQFAFVIPLLVWGAELVIPAISAYVIPVLYTASVGIVAYGGYKTAEALNKNVISKVADVYVSDRPLPQTQDGIPIPDTDAPHTQLGSETGRKGKYPQAREFDENGKPIRDIDFTDHGRPHDHTCPHQHKRLDNPTGGTRKRDDPTQVPEWNYK